MKYTKGKWAVSEGEFGFDIEVNQEGTIGAVYGNDSEAQFNANLIASAPEMLELLKNILGEVRPEISRVNEEAGQTIFNPVATETIDMAKALISKAEGRREGIVS